MEGYLKLNGIKMPDPKLEGVTFVPEKIWSKKTGRAASGKMAGDIVDIKETISIEFPPLSPSQEKLIKSVVSNKNLPFFSFEFCDGETITNKTVYAGSPSCKLYSTVAGIRYYTGYKVELVEQ